MKNETVALIEAAEVYASGYDDDDREDVKTDVLNAFYQGAAYGENCADQRIKVLEKDVEVARGQYEGACDIIRQLERELVSLRATDSNSK